MSSETNLEKLLGAMVTWITSKQSYATKTKLLKLLYLFDVEYYRAYRKIYTEFSWKFFHLGPWAPEYESVLESAITGGIISRRSSRSEYEVSLLFPEEQIETESIFANVKDELILRKVLNLWALSSTGEILDYVYFQSPPMESAIRNQLLDFSVIPEEKPSLYVRTSSGKTQAQIQKLRKAFEKRQSEMKAKLPSVFEFTPPRYDDEFFEAMSKIEAS